MRFMMIMFPNAKAEAGGLSEADAEAFKAMGKFNDEMKKAGVLLSLDGLQPTSKGARVSFAGGKPKLTNGPFSEPRQVGGYWLIDVKSRQEAIDWAMRCPAIDGDTIEIRQIYEIEDFPIELRKAVGL
jgi:hypothetical protein